MIALQGTMLMRNWLAMIAKAKKSFGSVLNTQQLNTFVFMQQKAIDKIKEVFKKAEHVFGRKFELPEIRFDLKGTTAGQAIHYKDNSTLIRLNPKVLADNGEAFLEDTCPHESVHVITWKIYGVKIAPHGPYWKSTMRLLGYDPCRCHKLKAEKVRNPVHQKFSLFCHCREHRVGKALRRRFLLGRHYICGKCKAPLKAVKPIYVNY